MHCIPVHLILINFCRSLYTSPSKCISYKWTPYRIHTFKFISDRIGFCKIYSDLWTFSLFYTQSIAFGMLCMIGQINSDNTSHWPRKSIFYDQTTKQLSLKVSEFVENKRKIVGGENSPFHLSADKKLYLFDNWLYWNRLVQIGQHDRNETLETISMNRINFTYASSRTEYN